jgi:hypothetical protein
MEVHLKVSITSIKQTIFANYQSQLDTTVPLFLGATITCVLETLRKPTKTEINSSR